MPLLSTCHIQVADGNKNVLSPILHGEKKNIMVQHGLCALAKTIKLMNLHEKYAILRCYRC